MPNYAGLVQAMKKAGTEAVNAGGPVAICFGKVMSVSPLQVLVDQKMTLGAAQLVLTRNVTNFEIPVTVEWETESELATHTHQVEGVVSDSVNLKHVHALKGMKKLTIHNSLVKGDEVVLLRQQGGQKYIILDRVG